MNSFFCKWHRKYYLKLVARLFGWLILALWVDSNSNADAKQPPQEASFTAESIAFFETKIRPLLVERCAECHGESKQWASLRVDSRSSLLAGGDSGPAINLEKPDLSELLSRVSAADPDVHMPPPETGPPLSQEQIDLLKAWIGLGAPWPSDHDVPVSNRKTLWESHWAFLPINAASPLPSVSSETFPDWLQHPIDRYVLKKLQEHHLTPSAKADPGDLVRRVTYTLTGLPPTKQAIEAFERDPSFEAYKVLVESLLESPEYGEHWGRHWLDVARYSDTKGYVYGREENRFVHATHYRDWVIDAFNRDLPYDQFVLSQMAADQILNLDPRDLAAMGFLTLGRRFLGITPDIIDDRIDVVSRGLLGLTVGCARCHDHKYDPIPTADYYSLYGVFENSIDELTPVPPKHPPRTADGQSDSSFELELAERKRKFSEAMAKEKEESNARLRNRLGEYLLAQKKLDLYPEMTFNQIVPKEDLVATLVRRWHAFLIQAEQKSDPIFSAWIAYASLEPESFETEAIKLHQTLIQNNGFWNASVRELFSEPPKNLEEVAARYQSIMNRIEKKWLFECERAKQLNRPQPTAFTDAADEQLRLAFYGIQSPCVMPEGSLLNTEWYWDSATGEELWKLSNAIDQWLLQSDVSLAQSPHVVTLADRHQRLEPQIFRRGNPANKGATVSRHMVSLGKPVESTFQIGSGRLELAKAIIAPENPLASRVWVNRIWAHHFGAGLVTTPSDFGTRANPPSHPELLDWLASRLMELKWSTKALHREILLSQTYMQASSTSKTHPEVIAKAMEIDPENRLLWRMNPRKLSIEQYRDTLLTVSGQLDKTSGGMGSELFGKRRSIYLSIDRRYLPNVFSVFDMANPDLHSAQRTETTIPQQALFALNHPFVIERAKDLAAKVAAQQPKPEQASAVFSMVLGREPSSNESEALKAFLQSTEQAFEDLENQEPTLDHQADWSYGYGKVDPVTGIPESFQPLPHFTGTTWQGGLSLPDANFGWVYLDAEGGHPGNDHNHAAIRRWTSAETGSISVVSQLIHRHQVGDGVAAWIVSSRHGVLKSAKVHNRTETMSIDSIEVAPGDTLDFVVDVVDQLNTDQFEWASTIQFSPIDPAVSPTEKNESIAWNSKRDFTKSKSLKLSPLEQLAHALLMSNEFIFVD